MADAAPEAEPVAEPVGLASEEPTGEETAVDEKIDEAPSSVESIESEFEYETTEGERSWEGDEEMLEEHEGEQQKEDEEKKVEEEEFQMELEEEEPVDPAAPYNLSDSKEALKAPFELNPLQAAEVKELWDLYQNCTPAYSDINGYVTETEAVYMLKCLNLMTYTPEQLMELITYCVRPPHPENHIEFEHFVHMVTIRQRDMPIEEELRLALETLDADHDGTMDREFFMDAIGNRGYKMNAKNLHNFMTEVDVTNDGTIAVEDVVGAMCIDLNTDDIAMLQSQLTPFLEELNPNANDNEDA